MGTYQFFVAVRGKDKKECIMVHVGTASISFASD